MDWSISPIALTLSWHDITWPVRWYGLFFACTFVYGLSLFRWIYRREGKKEDEVYDLVLLVIAGTLIGARLGFVLFYDPVYFLAHPLEILYVWKGGLASHGAVLGILISLWMYARCYPDHSFLWLCDRIGMAVPLSGCVIRLGNFFNSELYGIPAGNIPWAVRFLRVDDIPRHPVQLYESLAYLLIFLYQWDAYRRCGAGDRKGLLFGNFLVMVYGMRILLEFFKPEQARWLINHLPLTMGQMLSFPLVITGAVLVFRARSLVRIPAA